MFTLISRLAAPMLAALLLFTTLPAHAIDLGAAKAQGLVGETPSGYLGAVQPPSGDVQQLINSINAKRKTQYEAIAKKNGTSLQAVEALAGKQAIDKTPRGQFVKVNNQWVKK